jgi:hypothetical protein
MAESTRKTRVAIVQETTEGTLKAPSSTGEYIAVQDGLSLTPSFETLENAEFKASIGASKTILGLESPEGSVSHYCYHSGVEGTEPEIDLLMKAGFGASSIAATQYDTVSGSTAGNATTAAIVKVDTGEGATFERGEALLIKDSSNGYSIRPIESIAGNDLSLGFNLSAAPALGVTLGRAVLYKPADSGHPTLSVWDYRGNGAVVQAMAGARVTEIGFEASAGELINMNFSFNGSSFFWNPVEILAADRFIDFTDDSGTFAASIPAKMYRDPHELAATLGQAMTDTASAQTYTVTYSDSTGKYNIKGTGTLLSLLWNTGANAANTIGDKIGFITTSNDTGIAATTGYTSDNAIGLSSPQTPALDGQDPVAAKHHDIFLGDFADNVCFHPQSVSFTLSNEVVSVPSICQESGVKEKVINGRSVSVEIQATLDPYEAEKFRRFRSNEETRFMYAGGVKSGGNWVAGKCFCLYIPKCTISSIEVNDADGVVALSMTLSAYTASGEGEVFFNFV